MKSYLPFENITYETRVDSSEILRRLSQNIEVEKQFRARDDMEGNSHKKYEGRINGNSFRMTRIINYKNSFLPVIKGIVSKDDNMPR